jgi:hypothetical protein
MAFVGRMRRVLIESFGHFTERPAMALAIGPSALQHVPSLKVLSYTNVWSSQPLDIKRPNVRIVSSHDGTRTHFDLVGR